MKALFLIPIVLISASLYADELILTNPTDNANEVIVNATTYKLEPKATIRIPIYHYESFHIIYHSHVGRVGMCQLKFQEKMYDFDGRFTVETDFQPFISWTDCPSKVYYSSFNQENWYRARIDRDVGPDYSFIKVMNLY